MRGLAIFMEYPRIAIHKDREVYEDKRKNTFWYGKRFEFQASKELLKP